MSRSRTRASTMTGKEFRFLREYAGFSTEELAGLMDCHAYTIRNIESLQTHVSKPMARLLTLLVYPRCKGLVPAALEYREEKLRFFTDKP